MRYSCANLHAAYSHDVKKGPSTVHGRTGWSRDGRGSEGKEDSEYNENEERDGKTMRR